MTATLVDAAIPGLPLAFDEGQLRNTINRQVRAEAGGVRIADLQFDRFRYRAGKRAVFLYRCLVERIGGERRSTGWVAADLYKGSKARKEFSRLIACNEAAKPCHEGNIVLIEDAGMLCTLFPFDHKLPGLHQASSSGLSPLRYRPHISATFLDQNGDTPTFVKYVQRKEFHVIADPQWQDPAFQFAEVSGLALPALQQADEATAMLRWSKVPGRALSEFLDSPRQAASVASQLGHALGRVSLATRSIAAQANPWLQARQQSDRLLEFLAHPALAGPARIGPLRRGLHGALERVAPGLVHGDLKPEHVLVDADGSVGLVDIETMGMGLPALDAGNLCARLCMCHALSGMPADAGVRTAAAFAEAWLGANKEGSLDMVAAGLAVGYVRLAVYFVQHATHGWQHHMEHCMEVAERSLRGGIPWG